MRFWERAERRGPTRDWHRFAHPQKGGPRVRRQEVEDSVRDGEFKVGQFKVRLALSLRHCGFSPQLWFVYFDLEDCVQFLCDHIQEMKMSQEVRYIS